MKSKRTPIGSLGAQPESREFREIVLAMRTAIAARDCRILEKLLSRFVGLPSVRLMTNPLHPWVVLETERSSASTVIDSLLSSAIEMPAYHWTELIQLVDGRHQRAEILRDVSGRLDEEERALLALSYAVACVRDEQGDEARYVVGHYLEQVPAWQWVIDYWLCGPQHETVRYDAVRRHLERAPARPDLVGICRRWRRNEMRPAHISLALESPETMPLPFWAPDVFGYVPPHPSGEKGLYIGRSYHREHSRVAWSFIVASDDEEARYWMRHLPVYDEQAEVDVRRLYDVYAKRSGLSRPWPTSFPQDYLRDSVSRVDHTGFNVVLGLLFGRMWALMIVDPLRPYEGVHEYAEVLPSVYQQALATGLFG